MMKLNRFCCFHLPIRIVDYFMFNRILYFNNKRCKELQTGGNMATKVGSVGMFYQLLFKGYWKSESVSRPNASTCSALNGGSLACAVDKGPEEGTGLGPIYGNVTHGGYT